jgi:hypothetical protein
VSPLALLLVGGVIVPFAGWLVGVVLLWVSEVWTSREKLIGTLVVPGGLLPASLWVVAGGFSGECSSAIDPRTHEVVSETCTGGASTGAQIFWIAAFAVLVAAPLATTVFLARRLRRDGAVGAQPGQPLTVSRTPL